MEVVSQFQDFFTNYSARIAIAALVLFIGYFLVKILKTVTIKAIEHSKIDSSVTTFLKSLFGLLYYLILLMLVLTIAGIPSSYFAGLIIGFGTALGFSLRDQVKTLSNGIIILVTKPFKVKDAITAGQYSGTVTEIKLFHTHLKTFDNLDIIISNGSILNSGLIILNANDTRRQDLIIGVSYDDDILKVKKLLQKIIDKCEYVLKEPIPLIELNEFSDSSVNFLIRIWVERVNFQKAKFSINEQVKLIFDKENVSIPYPQRDIHMISTEITNK
jgi:small conductance mechanosensitive channel